MQLRVNVEAAERTLIDMTGRAESVTDRLGAAKGFEALARTQRKLRPLGGDAVAVLRRLATPGPDRRGDRRARAAPCARGAHYPRLPSEATLVGAASHDPDAQVRRIAMRAAAVSGASGLRRMTRAPC